MGVSHAATQASYGVTDECLQYDAFPELAALGTGERWRLRCCGLSVPKTRLDVMQVIGIQFCRC
jgi:hypothetical protein